MNIQVVDIFYPSVFKRYSQKFNIYRELYEKDLLGLEIREIDYRFAQKVKKIILVNKEICYTTQKNDKAVVDLLALGSFGVFKELAKEIIAIGNEDIGFKINKVLQNISNFENREITLGFQKFRMDRAIIMGILNVTPDSFSDGGKYFSRDKAVDHGLKLFDEGADIIDVGGESTRPGSLSVPSNEELNRVIPVIQEIKKQKPNALISIDTQKSNIAKEALKYGASIVNDVSAGEFDKKIFDVVKEFNATYVVMHMKGKPINMQDLPYYDDVVTEIYDFLVNKINSLIKFGIKNLLIDPGIGFGKTIKDNYELIRRLNEFKGIGYPILIGISNKSFLGKVFNIGIEERQDPTLIAESFAIKNGARIIRTHNVSKVKYAKEINCLIENPELINNV
ncbi:MAG: dihydropteroate synthase [Ignavibacteria bacterium]|nr:dihydropteroate synthase [Ignavibacteria bacterium]